MKQNKTIVAITGTIGSGKSTVRSVLEENGEYCLDCDKINSELLRNETYLIGLKEIFPEAFPTGNSLDKSIINKAILDSEQKRFFLNNYSHPKIKEELKKQINYSTKNLIFVEVPILNQTDEEFINLFNKIWVIISSKINLINRISNRDNINNQIAVKKIFAQNNIFDFKKDTIYLLNNKDIYNFKRKVLILLQNTRHTIY